MNNNNMDTILIGGSNHSTINIASSFKYDTDLQAKTDRVKMMKLPTELYPPNWGPGRSFRMLSLKQPVTRPIQSLSLVDIG